MRVGRYVLTKLIGQGGMAEVWHGHLSSIGGFEREVAVKLLLPQYACDTEFVDMLLDEARIAGSIAHSNVVQVMDVGRDDDRFYLVMEHVGGTDVRGLIRRTTDGRLPLEVALYVISEVARGLEAVHNAQVRGVPRKIIHRDISPSNVLVSSAGEIKLADFGIAHAAQRLTRTRAGSVKGKTRYMSPEQLQGHRLDARSDLYSLGVVMAELLVGPSVFLNNETAPGRSHILTEASRARLPDEVIAVLRNALAPRPEQRPTDAYELGCQCAELLHGWYPGYDQRLLQRYVKMGPQAALPSPVGPHTISPSKLDEAPTRQSTPLSLGRGKEDDRRYAPGTELRPVRRLALAAGSRF